MHDGNRTFLNKLVNFNKFRMIAAQTREITALKLLAYAKDTTTPQHKQDAAMAYVRHPLVILDTARLSKATHDYEN